MGEGEDARAIDPTPTPPPDDPQKPDANKPDANKPDANKPDANKPDANKPDEKEASPYQTLRWPQVAKPHPLATSVPREATQSIRTLGQYFKDKLPNQIERLRAMHDWAALSLTYDYAAIDDNTYMYKQGAAQVLQSRLAVCSGYSNLMVALGKITGDRILYITGDSRDDQGQMGDAAGHAWNAVELEGGWSLMDVTWDSPNVNGGRPKKNFATTYFLTPAKVMGLDHFPDQASFVS